MVILHYEPHFKLQNNGRTRGNHINNISYKIVCFLWRIYIYKSILLRKVSWCSYRLTQIERKLFYSRTVYSIYVGTEWLAHFCFSLKWSTMRIIKTGTAAAEAKVNSQEHSTGGMAAVTLQTVWRRSGKDVRISQSERGSKGVTDNRLRYVTAKVIVYPPEKYTAWVAK